jgi:hypothetical protein
MGPGLPLVPVWREVRFTDAAVDRQQLPLPSGQIPVALLQVMEWPAIVGRNLQSRDRMDAAVGTGDCNR